MSLRVGSLFTGVGGFDLGLESVGMEVVWQVENDRFCREVLRARWPDVNLYGDVRDVGADQLEPVDLVCGGFPCQDVSVAGRREGLAGSRSGLFFEFVRVARAVDARWLLVENVPGLLSSNGGADFATVLRELTGFPCAVPSQGWSDAGVCEGPLGRAIWRVLDTQYFGPPQRRRRVFVVVDSRAECRPEVLLEPESVPGNPAPRREAGEGAAGESAGGTFREGWPKRRAGTINAHYGDKWGLEDQHVNQGCPNHVPVAFNATQDPISEEEKNPTLSDQGAAVFADLRRHAEGHRGMVREKSCLNATNNDPVIRGVRPLLEVNARQSEEVGRSGAGIGEEGDPMYTLSGKKHGIAHETAGTMPASAGTGGFPKTDESVDGYVQATPIPRRLTPRECERLQGFPDDWTAEGVDADGEPTELSDTQRYKQMGNAVTVPVAAWIGARIVREEER